MPTITTQPVLVPWDFSEMSSQALEKAVDLAQSLEQIDVVHVTPYASSFEPYLIPESFSEEVVREKITESFHKEVPEDKYAGLKFTILFGDPGIEIVKYAKEVKAGVIVISSHGRTGIRRFLMGSVAERVVRLAPCPVLVLRQDDDHVNKNS